MALTMGKNRYRFHRHFFHRNNGLKDPVFFQVNKLINLRPCTLEGRPDFKFVGRKDMESQRLAALSFHDNFKVSTFKWIGTGKLLGHNRTLQGMPLRAQSATNKYCCVATTVFRKIQTFRAINPCDVIVGTINICRKQKGTCLRIIPG